MMKRVFVSIYTVVLIFTLVVQANSQNAYLFHHLTSQDGLSNNSVGAILKDQFGFLWIGTESGLNRYDGYSFKTYSTQSGSPNTMLFNNIWDLQEDGLGNIWITSFTYMLYNRDKDNFISNISEYLEELGIQVDNNYKIHVDKNKDLWVLSGQNAFFFDTQNKKLFKYKIDIETNLDAVNFCDDGVSIYGIIKPGFLWQMDKRSGNQKFLNLQAVQIANPESYNRVFVDNHARQWLLSNMDNIIYFRENQHSEWKNIDLSSIINNKKISALSIAEDENGRIWIGSDHDGLFIYDPNTESLINLKVDPITNSSIASNNIGCLYKDSSGIIWMGHNKKGISFYHNSFNTIENVNHYECRDVSAILEDRQGNIWLGTDGNGLYMKEKSMGDKLIKLPIGDIPIVSMLEDKKGRIWIGTYLAGIFRYEDGKFTHFTNANSKLAANDIWNIKEDRYGKIWIGSLGGGIQYVGEEQENLDHLVSVCETMKYPLDMYYDDGDKLYVGTVYGLYEIDITEGDFIIHVGNNQGTQSFTQMSIGNVYKDLNGNIWLGHSEGITLWDLKKDTLIHINKNNGVSDNLIHGIVEDNFRKIWVTSSKGLTLLSTDRNSNGDLQFSARVFTSKDGFRNDYFNNHSICKLRNGDILMGGTEGYSIVNPNKLARINQPPGEVIFTGLSVGNNNIKIDSVYKGIKLLTHPMELTDSLTFRYNDKLISIQFATSDIINANNIKYVYKLEGFNQQWVTTSENKVVFSSLAPGKYRLLVKASDDKSYLNDQTSELNIIVTPPFYLSQWAIIFYVILSFSLILFIIYRTRKHHHSVLDKQRVEFEREKENNLNEMKLRFFTNVSHDLRTPLTLITTPLQSILNGQLEDGIRKKLETINKNAEQLLTLINSLLDFRKLDAGAEALHLKSGDFISFTREICIPFYVYAVDRHMGFSFSSDLEKLPMQFDPEKVQKIILNLLSNAFKFTPDGGTVKINVYREMDNLYVNVTDSGSGIRMNDKKHIFEPFYQATYTQEMTGSGIGLHIVNEYVRMHGGTIIVKDNLPHGSTFTFSLPIIEIETEINDEQESENLLEDIEEFTDEVYLPQVPVLLFVDDNKDFCEFMEDSLSDEYTVIIAYNGQEALEHLQKADISIVVSDIMMPVMDGTELCRQIKTNIHWSHIPVILLTARTAEEYKIEGLEMGADDYITKPFNFNLLKLRLKKFLEWTEKCHASFSQKLDITPSEITITPLDEKLIEKAIKVVEENINNPEFTVEELGSEVGLSRSHLYKKLMYITGKGPAEFIRIIRLKRGRQLLEKSQLQIAEIAYTVGFNSPKRFTINFKNEFGISPSEYLRSLNSAR